MKTISHIREHRKRTQKSYDNDISKHLGQTTAKITPLQKTIPGGSFSISIYRTKGNVTKL